MKAEQLRKSILQMAIQGKLVPQDPTDEPASVLLEKIRTEKQKLIKEGKIKKDKLDSVIFRGDDNRHYEKIGNEKPKCIDDELPFDIPDSWEWARLCNFAISIFSGKSPKYSKEATQHKVIGQQANQWGRIDLQYIKYCTNDFAVDMPNYYYLQDGDILLNTLGNGTLGRSGYFDKSLCADPILTDGHLFVFRNYNKDLSKFLRIYLRIKYDEIVRSANGSTNQTFLNLTQTSQWLIPVPTLNEIKKIVAEIDKYEPLILEYDQLDQAKSKLDSEIYDKLKKSILQYAIQGKLVSQDPSDEPAGVLLESIRAEKKAQLGKKYVDSYIYKGDDNCYYEHIEGEAQDSPIETPFDIPENWCWARISFVTSFQEGPGIMAKDFRQKGVPLIRIAGMQTNRVSLSGCNYLDPDMVSKKWSHFCLDKGDVVISASASMDKIAEVYEDTMGAILYTGLIRFKMKEGLYKDYFKYFIRSECYIKQINMQKSGTTIQHYGPTHIQKMIIPIPPLAEQERLVEKINEIFATL